MPKTLDAISKTLLELSPVDWPHLAGYAAEEAYTIDSDTSIVSGAADKAVRVKGNPDRLMHTEFQSGPDSTLPQRMNLDSAILEDRTGLQVRSAVVLLHRKANLRIFNGRYECRFPEDSEPYRIFRYRVIRIWEIPAETLLTGGLSLLPLALISNVATSDLPGVIERIRERTAKIRKKAVVERIWATSHLLTEWAYNKTLADNLFKGVFGMIDLEESPTYQALIQKGREKQIRKMILSQGQAQFGSAATAKVTKAIEQMTSLEELEALGLKLLKVRSWEALLGLPAKKTRRPRS